MALNEMGKFGGGGGGGGETNRRMHPVPFSSILWTVSKKGGGGASQSCFLSHNVTVSRGGIGLSMTVSRGWVVC